MQPKNTKVRAHFFKDDRGRSMVELKVVGDPNTLIRKVIPTDLDTWPVEWAAFNSGQEMVDVGGTPLTEVPGITRDLATAFRLKGVRNVEELAVLDDAGTRALGMQGLAFRRSAQLILKEKEFEAMKALTAEMKRGPGRPPKVVDQPGAVS